MTLGDLGAMALCDGVWTYSPAFEVTCSDTTGAGDVFHGGFCFGILRGMPLWKAMDFANAAAALNCTAVGARGHIAGESEVLALLECAAAGKTKRRVDPEIAERCRAAVVAGIAG
jgi:sulfofructose kinase